jgi:hypothetical protein
MEDTNNINIVAVGACSAEDDQSATNAQAASQAPNRLTMSHRAGPTNVTLEATTPKSSNQQQREESQASPLNADLTTTKAEDNDTSNQ